MTALNISFKKRAFILIGIISVFVQLFVACKKDKNSENVLPAITQQGLNTFGCMVNGKVLIPKSRGLSDVSVKLNASYRQENNSLTFALDATNTNDPAQSIRFHSVGLTLSESKFLLTDNSQNSLSVVYEKFISIGVSKTFKVTEPLRGEFTISQLDPDKKIISGTFWFDAENETGEKVEVRDGRFDVKYD